MVSVAALLLMILAFAAIGYPLLRPAGSRRAIPIAEEEAANELQRARDAAYGAIKELEAEYRLGHLSREDYEALREEYVERAASSLWHLEAAEAASARSARTRRAACPACGGRRHRNDRFCGTCGLQFRDE